MTSYHLKCCLRKPFKILSLHHIDALCLADTRNFLRRGARVGREQLHQEIAVLKILFRLWDKVIGEKSVVSAKKMDRECVLARVVSNLFTSYA